MSFVSQFNTKNEVCSQPDAGTFGVLQSGLDTFQPPNRPSIELSFSFASIIVQIAAKSGLLFVPVQLLDALGPQPPVPPLADPRPAAILP